jgi:hypothetical protein
LIIQQQGFVNLLRRACNDSDAIQSRLHIFTMQIAGCEKQSKLSTPNFIR